MYVGKGRRKRITALSANPMFIYISSLLKFLNIFPYTTSSSQFLAGRRREKGDVDGIFSGGGIGVAYVSSDFFS